MPGVAIPDRTMRSELASMDMSMTEARKHGHEVLYTPPYHPELQPIEMIWGTLKNRIALDPATSLVDLGEKTPAGLNAIGRKEWLGAYKKVQKQEQNYLDKRPPSETIPAPTREELASLALAEYEGVEISL